MYNKQSENQHFTHDFTQTNLSERVSLIDVLLVAQHQLLSADSMFSRASFVMINFLLKFQPIARDGKLSSDRKFLSNHHDKNKKTDISSIATMRYV